MKKLLAILLAAVMLFSFAACGKTDNSGVKEQLGSGSLADKDANVNENNDADVEETTEKKIEVSRGSLTGNTYTNEFVGFRFNAPADWKYMSDAEMAEAVQIGVNASDYSNFKGTLDKIGTIYDAIATDEYGNSVMVCYENTETTGDCTVNAMEYHEILKKQLESQTALNYTYQTYKTVVINGTSFIQGIFKVESNGTEIDQFYLIRISENYAVTIMCSLTTYTEAEMLAMFS